MKQFLTNSACASYFSMDLSDARARTVLAPSDNARSASAFDAQESLTACMTLPDAPVPLFPGTSLGPQVAKGFFVCFGYTGYTTFW